MLAKLINKKTPKNESIIDKRKQLTINKLKQLTGQLDLDLRQYYNVLTDELLEEILVNNKGLKTLNINNCDNLTRLCIYTIAKHCPQLTGLSTQHMPWHIWSTKGVVWDSYFPELKELYINGCYNLEFFYIIAPKLENPENIARVFNTINTYEKHPISYEINKKTYHIAETTELLLKNLPPHANVEEIKTAKNPNLINQQLREVELIEIINKILNDYNLCKIDLFNIFIGGNKGLLKIIAALAANQKIAFLHLYPTPFEFFDDVSLIPLFKTLTHQQTLQSLGIMGYFTDDTALAIATMLKQNQTLNKLELVQSASRNFAGAMSNKGVMLIAEALQYNPSLTTVSLRNIITNVEACKTLADALQINKSIIQLKLENLEGISVFTYLLINRTYHHYILEETSKDSQTHLQMMRILKIIYANRIRTQPRVEHSAIQAELVDSIETSGTQSIGERLERVATTHRASSLEEKHSSAISLSLFNRNDSNSIKVFGSLLSNVPEDIPANLHLNRASSLEEKPSSVSSSSFFNRNESSSITMFGNNPKLHDYFEKFCYLIYYIKASHLITTQLLAKEDDVQDTAVKVSAIVANSAIGFIPVISGFSSFIDAAAGAELFRHGVEKHRRAENVTQFTHCLKVKALVMSLAREYTFKNQEKIINADHILSSSSYFDYMTKLIPKGIQKYREYREGTKFTPQQILGLMDCLRVFEALATKKIVLPKSPCTEESHFDKSLEKMLEFMHSDHSQALLSKQVGSIGFDYF